jgi:hypothetical protein
MWLRLSSVLLILAFPASFPAKTAKTFRQRYGLPVSETFLVRPGVVVSASYGASGDTCELVVNKKQPDALLIKRWPGSETIDYKLLKEIEDELIPTNERGKFKTGSFLNILCPPEYDCEGTGEEWEKVTIYKNAGEGGARYEVIGWARDECSRK